MMVLDGPKGPFSMVPAGTGFHFSVNLVAAVPHKLSYPPDSRCTLDGQGRCGCYDVPFT